MEDVYEKLYKRNTKRRFSFLYTELITEMLLEKYYGIFEKETKESILNEVVGLRYFTKKEIDNIFNNAIKLLEIKYNLQVIDLNPIKFEKLKDEK